VSAATGAGRHLTPVVHSLLAVLIAGCIGTAGTPIAGPDLGSEPGSGAGDPGAGDPGAGGLGAGEPVATFATFVAANGFGALPEAVVRLEGRDDDGVSLEFRAVVADTPDTRARGLMGVDRMPVGVGMLFVFPEPAGPGGRPGFWMLDTLTPLDIAFVADGTIVGVATMTPCAAQPCPITHPGVPYDMALEVAAGALDDAGVRLGDRFVVRAVGE